MRQILKLVLLTIFSCNMTFAQKMVFFNSKKLPETINSELAEVLPILSSDGKTLYFVRDGLYGGEGSEDIWYSKKDANGNWSEALNDLDNLNNKESNFIIGSSRENNRIYLRNAYDKKQNKVISVAASNYENGHWSEPYNVPALPDFGFKGKNYSMYISHNEDILFISMNIPGSEGQEDLYLLRKNGENWSQPIHLGKEVNSKGIEMSPFITEDGMNLFFASDGHGGFGDMDIFYSKRLDDSYEKWSEPINLGKNINSPGFDAYFHMSHDNKVYYCSTRGEAQYDDIYESEMHFFEKQKRTVIIHDINNYEIVTKRNKAEKKFRFINIESLKDYLITHKNDTLITGDLAEFEYDIVFQLDSGSKLKEKLMKLKNVKGYETLEELLVEEKFLEGEKLNFNNLDAMLMLITKIDEGVTDSNSVNNKDDSSIILKNNITFSDINNIKVFSIDKNGKKDEFKFENIESLKNFLIKHNEDNSIEVNSLMIEYNLLFELTPEGELKKKLLKLKNVENYQNLEQLYIEEKILTANNEPIYDINLILSSIQNLENAILNNTTEVASRSESKSFFVKGQLLKTIYHEYDSDKSKSISLTDIITVLNNNPDLKILIESHTDSKGSDEYNNNLSIRRATVCKTFLIKNGVHSSRISTKGLGEKKPIEPNNNNDDSDNVKGREKNRRTEFRVN